MERGVYFDAWFPRQHCYHPSLPPRRLRMIEDLEEYRATSLVWSALGGGSISLPYLEQEAWQQIDPRFRFYGFMNDAEFIEECQRRGIKVFGIVFEVQGWEFPVELSPDESEILAMNELRGVGRRAWLGLREFTQNTYPKLWAPLERYFPRGLTNSDGEPVTDLIEECVSRDVHGAPLHAVWVEAPDREHHAYLMDRNNPVWREYLKAIIRIQIDAGVAGVQLDEADLPLFSMRWGGCFCKDCMKLFRAYLQQLPDARLPAELKGEDLEEFHYGSWLLERGYDFKTNREMTPLYWDYVRFQRRAVTESFVELCAFVRECGASKGREVLVACNSGECPPHFYALQPHVDLLAAEQHETRYRQPSWCRYAAGFAGETPLVIVEQPFAGVVPELAGKLAGGDGYDLFRMMHYEAAALGINMCIPYGAWLGPEVEDSFWAPHELVLEIQQFLADHEDLYSEQTFSETVVAFSVQSRFEYEELHGAERVFPFWDAAERLASEVQPFDVAMLPDGDLRPDSITKDSFAQYRTLVLPECRFLTPTQGSVFEAFLNAGGAALVSGELGINLPESLRTALLTHPQLRRYSDLRAADLPGGGQVVIEGVTDAAINLHRVERGAAIHLIRYDYDARADEVPRLPAVTLDVRLPQPFRSAEAYSPNGELDAWVDPSARGHRVQLRNVPLYSIVLLRI